MSFLREGPRHFLWQWREVLVIAAILALGVFWALTGMGLLRWLGIALAFFCAFTIIPAFRLARLPTDVAWGAGAVDITERRIRYYRGEQSQEIALADLVAIDIAVQGLGKYRNWVLTSGSGPALRIPTAARGSTQLVEALSALNGIDFRAIQSALGATKERIYPIWRRVPANWHGD